MNALQDIEFHGISPQIYHLLKEQGLLALTPPMFQQRLKQKFDETLYLNLFIQSQMEVILLNFEEWGIPVIPLKGIRLAEKYFGHIGARGTSDIDLLVRKNDLKNAVECVKQLGFTTEQERDRFHFHWSFSKQLPGNRMPLTIELHWTLIKEHSSELPIDEFWEQATPVESFRYVRELSDYHMFYHICLHGWSHRLSSQKYFIDMIQMIHRLGNSLNYPQLLKDAARHKTRRRITRTLAIAYHQFPHLQRVRELPFPRRKHLWWDHRSVGGDNSYKNIVHFMCFQLLDLDRMQHRVHVVLGWLLKISQKR